MAQKTREYLNICKQASFDPANIETYKPIYWIDEQFYSDNPRKRNVDLLQEIPPFHVYSCNSNLITIPHGLNLKEEMINRYSHLGDPTQLVRYFLHMMFLVLLKTLSKHPQGAAYLDKVQYTLDKILVHKLGFLTKMLGSLNIFDMFLIKELFVTLLSFMNNSDDYYYYGSTKHSVIRDFFDSFLLLDLHHITQNNTLIDPNDIDYENTITLGMSMRKCTILGHTMLPNLLKFAIDTNISTSFLLLPIISDSNHSLHETVSLDIKSITKDGKTGIEFYSRSNKYSQMEPDNFHSDSVPFPYDEEQAKVIEQWIRKFAKDFRIQKNSDNRYPLRHLMASTVMVIGTLMEEIVNFIEDKPNEDGTENILEE